MSYTRIFEVTMPHEPTDPGMIAELNYFVRQGAALAWGDNPRDTRYNVTSRAPDEKATDNTNVNTGTVTGSMVQCHTISGGVQFGGGNDV